MLHEPAPETSDEPPQPTPSFETLPDVARKLRAMAAAIGAETFHLFAIGPRSERSRLVPCLDHDYPGLSQATRNLVAALPKLFGETASDSTRILCWAGAGVRAPLIGGLSLCERLAAPRAMAGIGLPACSERGQQGVAVFTGDHIETDGDTLLDMQAQCFRLFGIVARLRPAGGNALPVMSRRELECLNLTAEGLTSEEIARKLGLSVHTANQYLINTTQKLNAVNRVHAVAKAMRAGLVE